MNDPKTLTEAIQRIVDKLSGLAWAEQVYNRVAIHDVKLAGQDRAQLKPMSYDGADGYIDARPNDAYKSVVFFATTAKESNDYNQAAPYGHAQNHINRAIRPVTMYGWVNLEKLPEYDDQTGFPEPIKVELEKVLQTVRCVVSYSGYLDGQLNEVFKPFVISDLDTKYDRWPFACFRLDLQIMTIQANIKYVRNESN